MRYLLALAIVASLHGPSAAEPVTLVRAARLVDPRTGHVLAPAAVLVRGTRIDEVGPPAQVQAHAPAGTAVIDLGGAMLLPGLVDAHTHLLLDVIPPTQAEIERRDNGRFMPGMLLAIAEPPGKRLLLGAQLAREDLLAGFTTVRNLGHSGVDGDIVLRDAIDQRRVPGPRILASGRKLTAPGGYFRDLNPALSDAIVREEFLEVDGPDQARHAVRENAARGADVIKVALGDDVGPAEVAVVVDEAHRQHLKVAIHATTAPSIQIAIDAGADSIEHGNDITDAQLAAMRRKGMFFDLTPTAYGGRLTRALAARAVVPPELAAAQAARDDQARRRYDALVQRVLRSGVKFAAGSDMCWSIPSKTRGEATAEVFASLHRAGMSPLDVLRAVTTNAAEMLGWQDRIGTIERGKLADLVAVPGDPLTDATELERVRFVMKDGEVIRHDDITR